MSVIFLIVVIYFVFIEVFCVGCELGKFKKYLKIIVDNEKYKGYFGLLKKKYNNMFLKDF